MLFWQANIFSQVIRSFIGCWQLCMSYPCEELIERIEAPRAKAKDVCHELSPIQQHGGRDHAGIQQQCLPAVHWH